MQTTIPALGTTSWVRRVMLAAAAFGLLLAFAFAQSGLAQNNPLKPTNTYFVTGDYVVGGWQKTSPQITPVQTINGVPYVTGTISIPDGVQAAATGVASPPVPAGADIVAAFLYWETVESSSQLPPQPGQNGFFNGHAITATPLPGVTPNAPTAWSSGGCSGSSSGAKTIQGYRADVRPFLPLDTNSSSGTFGNPLGNGNFTVLLADSGSNGNTTPFTLGATLVVIYRVLAPTMPLNSIVLYDGTFAPSNTSVATELSQQIKGFYQAATISPTAKLTHIVGNGQSNKSETVSLNTFNLSSLYGNGTLPPFPGIYNGSWDNPTWPVSALVNPGDALATTSVAPTPTNGNCIDWGAVVFSTTVQDSDGDGLLDVWESNNPPGYTDLISNQFVALPGANPSVKDIFVEIDYLSNMDGKVTTDYKHSHLPKQEALDRVGTAFKNAPVDCDPQTHVCKGVQIHFDVGNVYQTPRAGGPSANCGTPPVPCDPYIVSKPAGTGGNPISESAVICNDSGVPPLCQFPGQVTTEFKGDLLFVRDNATTDPITTLPLFGNFQPGRGLSYHYVLFGHALGEEEFLWTTAGTQVSDPTITQLVSIVNDGTTTKVTINSPSSASVPPGFVINPGDCAVLAPPPAVCSDTNSLRVTVSGALGQPALNGTYFFTKLSSNTVGTTTTTVFSIPTSGVSPGITYNFSNEPQLSVSYLGPTTGSGHSDFGGGGDSLVTFGSWAADDPAGCQADPSQALNAGQVYCNNEIGSVLQQAGTLMHEVGHTLTLTHGGTYYTDQNNPSVPTYGLNCKSNFLSVMSYLFVIRGFPDLPDGAVDYSGQTFSPLDETKLDESKGIGLDSSKHAALHYTRWFGPPNALDQQLQNSVGSRYPIIHCDGTPIGANESPAVRVSGSTFSAPIDWNNNLIVPDLTEPVAWQDVDFNGSTSASPDPPPLPAFNDMQGFSDWQIVNNITTGPGSGPGNALRQISARAGAFGFSGNSGSTRSGGGSTRSGGGSTRYGGGSTRSGGGSTRSGGGSTEQDEATANSTADGPKNLTCTNCTLSGATFVEKGKSVPLAWTAPSFGQVRRYDVWRAVGSFPTIASILQGIKANPGLFTDLTAPNGITPVPPAVTPLQTFTDSNNLKGNTTYTYFITETNAQGVTSSASDPPITVLVKF